MAERAAPFRAVHLDVGTGDGAYVYRAARAQPDVLCVGVDANADGLREVSRRALAKPARGGVANALFGVLALERAPGELAGFVDALTVLLPWGTLLGAVARPEPDGLARLRALCKPGAQVRVVFGYDARADAAAITALGLPALDASGHTDAIERAYGAAGFDVTVGSVATEAVRALSTRWSQRLAFSGASRAFVEVRGRARAP